MNKEERRLIFEEYWKLADVNRQRDFISKHIVVTNKMRTRKPKTEESNNMEDSGSDNSYHPSSIKVGGILQIPTPKKWRKSKSV